MLHARLRGRQVRAWLIAALLVAGLVSFAPGHALAARSDDLATADTLSRTGQHAQAAALYESLAKRPFRRWDDRLGLLAAREYLAAKQLADAERMLDRVGTVRGDDAVLLARVQAELALAQDRPEAALEALGRLPEPWPALLAAELLRLRAQAEFTAGRLMDGLRTTEARVQLLGTADERRAARTQLVDALLASPDAAVPADATPSERAWFELGQVLGATDADPGALARRAADWRSRHPNHPGGEFLPAAAAGAATGAVVAMPAGPADSIALLLPLSGRMQAAGRAVRDGFLAAALAEPPDRRPRIELIDTAEIDAAAAYARALETGADAVAGPLLKEELAALIAAHTLPVPTLALNSLPMDSPPPFLFQFALDPEHEARAAARRIARDGPVHGIALFPSNTWGERVHEAFMDEARAAGLSLTSVQFYDPAARDFSGPLRAALGRFGGAGDRGPKGAPVRRDGAAEALAGPQFAFMAGSATSARALLPQLRYQMSYELPVYATSDALEPSALAVPDLNGLTFPEMPWILYGGLGAQQLWDVLQADGYAAARGRLRLYAFGFDAYGLLRDLNSAARGIPRTGLSGRLAIAPDGRVQRELEWARIESGQPQPAATVFLPSPPGEP
jgi:outer membrane PBP1 activator LpoA protein